MLVRIELSDFKSYRGHQVIGPFSHFNSIIGPNGAGKSNLMDAISFVLGVKSAQLRSSQLRDLIYRGRKLAQDDDTQPSDALLDQDTGEGTATKAWVLAVYEDADGKEWQFKRTITTAGLSEYRLNNKVVTYQAYNDALEKQNILVKAKNFLVFQGDVEAVASQSPLALTKLIEQISGSLELAAEYEEAQKAQERATENATFNYTKRRGLNGEIKQFKEQKSEAQRFESLLGERDALIRKKQLWQLYHIEESIEENVRQIKAHAKSLGSLRKDQQAQDRILSEARGAQAGARADVSKREKSIKKEEKALDKKRPELTETEAQIAHTTRKVEKAEKALISAKKDQTKLEEQVARIETDLAEVQKAERAALDASKALSSKKDVSLSPENLNEYRSIKAAANLEKVEERQKSESLKIQLKTSQQQLGALTDKLKQYEEQKTSLEFEGEAVAERQKELESKIDNSKTELAAARQDLNNAQSERERIVRTETEINEKLQDIHHKLLQAGIDRKESEREAAMKETLSTLQRLFPGVRGRMVDLCKPIQRKYETAVSVILGRNIDAVVVDQEKTAIECIQYMRDQRAGQATFIPLDSIQVKPINDKYRSFVKGARLAVDILEFDGTIERAIHYACANSLVCDSMEVAKHIVYDKSQEVKAVTLEGTIIHKSGLITGGRSAHGNARRRDEKELEGLKRQNEILLGQLRDLNQSKQRGPVDDSLIADITRLEHLLSVDRDDLSAATLRLAGIRDELKHIAREMQRLAPDIQKTQKSHDASQKEATRLSSLIEATEDKMFAAFCKKIHVDNIRDYEGRQLKHAEEENEARLRFRTQLARLNNQLDFEKTRLSTLKERSASLEALIQGDRRSLSDLEEKRDAILADLEADETKLQELRTQLKDSSELLDQRTKELEEVKREHAKVAKSFDKLLKEISAKNDDIEKLGVSRSSIYRKCHLESIALPLLKGNLNIVLTEEHREAVDMDVDGVDKELEPRAIPDYGIEVDFDELDDEDRTDGSAEAGKKMEEDIAKLSSEIEKMSPNMKAMDKLDDVEAKLVDMDKETDKARKDSKLARDHFQSVKKQRSERFMKAFDHISQRIDAIYKELTKGRASPMGGVAYLSLEESEEPYLGGIKYHAMPPMKRFRDMEQLSGGEKTIAALALLFAIHSYQPSPFFVLDEVDAALDNTNVAKIANYIRAQASNVFQFVVISLKGSLYERSNSLVGIYRDQDANSSRTLTLDLSLYDE